jgi:hypothetical protein
MSAIPVEEGRDAGMPLEPPGGEAGGVAPGVGGTGAGG